MIEPNKLSPFRHFCMSIGAIPSSYKESLTYYEMLEWLCKYLEDTVIPAVNNNAEALEEVQEAFVTLKNYVDHYFDDLDIEQQIDDKLDEMAESGQLTDIIAQYLQLAGVLAFDTISDLVAAENIVNGSTCYVLGDSTYNDGNGAFYKIRTVTNSDVIDGFNIVALDVSDTLVAERLEEDKGEHILIMGDSYGAGDDTWIDKLITKIGDKATCYKVALGGLGFAHQSSLGGYTFQTYLQSQLSNIPNKAKITKIIVGGGYNDNDETYADITSAISSFCSYCKTNFPNARVYIAMLGFNSERALGGGNIRHKLATVVIPAYSYNYISEYTPIYIPNSELILRDTTLLGNDNVHPNAYGQNKIANCLYYWYLNGTMQYSSPEEDLTMQYSTDTVEVIRTDTDVRLATYAEITFDLSDNPMTLESNYHATKRNIIGTYTSTILFPSTTGECLFPTKINIVSNGTGVRDINALFGFTYDGKIVVYLHGYHDGTGWDTYTNVTSIKVMDPINIKAMARFN